MLANNNLKVCRTLIKRDFKFHRGKNCILIMAAALVTALYTFVFLLGNSVQGAFLLSYQYAYGAVSQILYTGLTNQQADAIAGNASVKNSVRLSTIGQLTDPMMGRRLVKLAVTDQAYAESVLSVPDTGRLPENVGEIALDEFTMDSLGVPRKLGTPVTVRWTDPEGGAHSTEFTLCGWWISPTIFTEACAWISADTALKLVSDYQGKDSHNVTLGVNLHQTGDLEQQAASVLEEQSIAGVSFTTNLACNEARREQAMQQAMPFYSPTVLVLLCGCLMIYCIVHVAARQDTMYYASLKSLGMTPRQIRRLLLEQGCIISFLGFFPGWALGFGFHFVITGRMIEGMEENPAFYFLSWLPFGAAAFCTLFTTLSAYLLPTIRLSQMTPVQTASLASGPVPRHRRSSDGRTTLTNLALRTTFGRNRWRTVLSVFSLLAAAVLLSSIWIQYVSFREDMYLAGVSPWDYSFADGSAYLSVQRYNENNRGITDSTVKELQARPEVTAVSALKSHEAELTASDELRRRIVDYYNQPYDETMTLKETQAAYPEWCDGLERLEQTGGYRGLIIGLDGAYLQYVLDNCPFTSGSFDTDAFASGDYVLAAGAYNEGISTPAAGETVELNGHVYTVLGSVMHDDAYISGTNSIQASFHLAYILPMAQFDVLFPGQAYRQLAVDIHPARQASFEAYLDSYEEGMNRGIRITRRSEYAANFEAGRLNEVLPNLVIGLVLLGIALVNFVNMLVVKTVSRKSEFAVYESLGMTNSQLRCLMILEGVFHAALMYLLLVPAVIFFAAAVMPAVVASMESWCIAYRFSVLPLWVLLPVILLLAIATPAVCLRFITKGSLTERMRRAE